MESRSGPLTVEQQFDIEYFFYKAIDIMRVSINHNKSDNELN